MDTIGRASVSAYAAHTPPLKSDAADGEGFWGAKKNQLTELAAKGKHIARQRIKRCKKNPIGKGNLPVTSSQKCACVTVAGGCRPIFTHHTHRGTAFALGDHPAEMRVASRILIVAVFSHVARSGRDFGSDRRKLIIHLAPGKWSSFTSFFSGGSEKAAYVHAATQLSGNVSFGFRFGIGKEKPFEANCDSLPTFVYASVAGPKLRCKTSMLLHTSHTHTHMPRSVWDGAETGMPLFPFAFIA